MKSLITIVFALVAIFAIGNFFIGGGTGELVAYQVVDPVEPGQLGAGESSAMIDTIAGFAELAFTFAVWVLSMLFWVLGKFSMRLSSLIETLTDIGKPDANATMTDEEVRISTAMADQELRKPLHPGVADDCGRLLIEAAATGNKSLTIALAETLAGYRYLHDEEKIVDDEESSGADSFEFPEDEGGAA